VKKKHPNLHNYQLSIDLKKSKLLAFGNKNKLLLHFLNRNFAELSIKITIFAAHNNHK